MTTIIMEEGRVLVRDEATGRTEELRLDDTNMQEAVELIVESDTVEDVRIGLEARGEKPKMEPAGRNAVQMVAWDRSGPTPRVLAASDPRKLGFSAAQ